MTHSLVIRNGTVVDGSGGEPFRADVAIDGGVIAEIGTVAGRGQREIDAEGHVVTPGFIDGHTHMDAQVLWDPLGTCSCWHGVTTVVMGNCGFTLAPGRIDQADLVLRNIERAENMARDVLEAGVDWKWETFAEYLDVLDRRPLGINYAAYVGHSALRSWAMGERAFSDIASDDDLRTMETQLGSALDAGAIGFSTSRTFAHLTRDDEPVASRLATWDEVDRLVRVLAERRRGVFEIAPGPGAAGDPEDTPSVYRQLCELNVDTGVPFTYGLFGTAEARLDRLAEIDGAVAAGGDIVAQTHCRGTSGVHSFRSLLPYDVLPEWKELRTLPIEQQLASLRDPATRRRLGDAARYGTYGAPVGTEPKKPQYDAIYVLKNVMGPNRTVAEIAAERGVDPVELMIDLILESGGEQFFLQPFTAVDPDVAAQTLLHPQTVMTLSDSGAHVSQIMDASIQTYFLAHWVRERQAITLAQAVHKMTAVPAAVWRIPRRGLLREGFVADVNVFDPATVTPLLPRAVNDLPARGVRLEQRSQGFLATIVAGEVLLDRGEHTGALPGQVIRDAGRYDGTGGRTR